jgi:hypothetical protein
MKSLAGFGLDLGLGIPVNLANGLVATMDLDL